jgi:hypothetical protein
VYELHEKKSRQLIDEIEKLKRQALHDKQQIEKLQEQLRLAQNANKRNAKTVSSSSPSTRQRNAEGFNTQSDEEITEYTPKFEAKQPLITPQSPPGCCTSCSLM